MSLLILDVHSLEMTRDPVWGFRGVSWKTLPSSNETSIEDRGLASWPLDPICSSLGHSRHCYTTVSTRIYRCAVCFVDERQRRFQSDNRASSSF